MQVTPNFGSADLDCHDGTPYPFDKSDDEDPQRRTWLVTRATPLCQTAEIIRVAVGTPLISTSGFRPIAYDQRIYDAHIAALAAKGLPNDHMVAEPTSSEHPEGRALDLHSPTLTPVQLYNAILRLFEGDRLPLLGGVGLYRTFVHIDIAKRIVTARAPYGHLRLWGGDRPDDVA